MTNSIKCSECGAKLRIKDSLRGKTLPCPRCQTPVTIPIVDVPVQEDIFANLDLPDQSFQSSDVVPATTAFPESASVPRESKQQPPQLAGTGLRDKKFADRVPLGAWAAIASATMLALLIGCGLLVFLSGRRSEPLVVGTESTESDLAEKDTAGADSEIVIPEPMLDDLDDSSAGGADPKRDGESKWKLPAETSPLPVVEAVATSVSVASEVLHLTNNDFAIVPTDIGTLVRTPIDIQPDYLAVSPQDESIAFVDFGNHRLPDDPDVLYRVSKSLFDGGQTIELKALQTAAGGLIFKTIGRQHCLIVAADGYIRVFDSQSLEPAFDDQPDLQSVIDVASPSARKQSRNRVPTGSIHATDDPTDTVVYLYEPDVRRSSIGGSFNLRKDADTRATYDFDVQYSSYLHNSYITVGKQAGIMDPHNKFAELIARLHPIGKFRIVHIFRDQPWVAVLTPTKLMFVNRNNVNDAKQFPLPSVFRSPQHYVRPLHGRFDPTDKSLVIWGSGEDQASGGGPRGFIWRLKLDELGLRKSVAFPSRLTRGTASDPLPPNREHRIDVLGNDALAKTTIVKGPQGLKIENNMIVWTPTFEQVGEHLLEVEIEPDGEDKQTFELPLFVGFPGMRLPFQISGAAISDDGRYVAAWNFAAMNKDLPTILYSPNATRKPEEPKMVIIDRQPNVGGSKNPSIVNAPLTRTIDGAFFYNNRLFTLTRDGLALLEFDPNTGKQQGVYPFSSPRRQLQRFGDRLVLPSINSYQRVNKVDILELPAMASLPVTKSVNFAAVNPTIPARQLEVGWDFGSAIFDKEFSRVVWQTPASFEGLKFANGASERKIPASSQSISFHTKLFRRVDWKRPNAILEVVRDDETRQKLSVLSANEQDLRHFHADDATLVFYNDKIFVYPHDQMGFDPHARTEAPIIVHAPDAFTVVPTNRDVSIPITILGGKAPYKVTTELKFRPIHGGGRPETVASVTGTTIKVRGRQLMECLLKPTAKQPYDGVYSKWFKGAGARSGNSGGDLRDYASRSRKVLNADLKKPLRGVPIGFSLTMDVVDDDGRQARWQHTLVIDLPAKPLLEIADSWSKLQTAAQQQNRSLAMVGISKNPEKQRVEFPIPRGRDFFAPDLPLVWDVQTPAALCVTHRQEWSGPAKLPQGVTLEALASAALVRGAIGREPRGVDWRDSRAMSEWLETKRPEFEFLKIKGTRGGKVYSPIGLAVESFQQRTGCYPPPALVDRKGKPLLSWRVLLLPDLGYSDLYSLFRLNEPFDSPHNRKLIPFMPPIFSSNDRLKSGHANVVAVTGPQTSFPHDRLRRSFELRQSYADTLSFAIVSDGHSIPWTQPNDLDVSQADWIGKLESQEMTYRTLENKFVKQAHFLGIRGRSRLQWLPLDQQGFIQSATIVRDGPGIPTSGQR